MCKTKTKIEPTSERVKQIIEDVIEKPLERTDLLQDYGILDSLMIYRVIISLEVEYDVEFEYEYFIKDNRNPSSIYLRLIHSRSVDVTKSTSLLIQPDYWNNKKGEVRKIAAFGDKVNLQNKLNDLKSVILNNFNQDYAEGKFINGNWLEDQIRSFFNQARENDLSFLEKPASQI